MLKLIRRISSDDSAVKLLFDHVRNVGICAVVFGAAAWQYKNLEPAGYIYYFQVLIISIEGTDHGLVSGIIRSGRFDRRASAVSLGFGILLHA